jgi:hypothetical protein
MTKAPSCPSEFALERLRFGELVETPEEKALIAHLDACPECRQRQRVLADAESPTLDSAAIWSRAFGRPGATSQPARLRGLRWAAIALVGVTTAAAVVLLKPQPVPDILTKGSAAHLGVIAKRRDGSTARIEAGARLSPGDRLRFEVSTRLPQANIALVMLDGGGAVTRLAPSNDRSLWIASGKRVLLDEAVELDGALGAERIVLVACADTVDTKKVVEGARRALADARGDPRQVNQIGSGCDEEAFSITKVKP